MSSLNRSRRRIFLFGAVALLILFALASPLSAASIRSADILTIEAGEVIDDDLFVAANTIVINGVVKGDLVAVSSNLIVNGDIHGSILYLGQSFVMNGTVKGTVYTAGTSMTVGPDTEIGRNLLFAGYSYRSEAGSSVERDLLVAGYQATLNGQVHRNVYASLGAFELNGRVGGDVQAVVETPDETFNPALFIGFNGQPLPPPVQPGMRVGPEAIVEGQIRYTSAREQTTGFASEPRGGVIYTAPAVATTTTPAQLAQSVNPTLNWTLARLREMVTLFLLGALALWLMPKLFTAMGEQAQNHTLLAAAWGILVMLIGYGGSLLLTIFVFAAIAGLAALTLAGLATSFFGLTLSTLGFAFTAFSMLVAYGSKLVVLFPVSKWLLEKAIPAWSNFAWVTLMLGVIVFVLLASIPWIGSLFSIVVTLIGLGSIWLGFRDRFVQTKPAAPKLALTPA